MDALSDLVKSGKTIGTVGKDLRARSFGFFVAGTSLGWLAMIYDSAGIVAPGMPHDSIPPLSGAQDVGKAAIVLLDSALAIANNPAAAAGFPLEAAWLGNATGFTLDQYKRLIRSYRARIRANNTRTPAQATAVDWAKVIDDAENGIQANFMVNSRRLDRLERRLPGHSLPGSDVERDVADVHGNGGRLRRVREFHRRGLQP